MRSRLVLLALLLTTGCIDSGNRGWDLGVSLDPETGRMVPSAWRGEHAGRIGFRCKAPGDVRLFVELWDPPRAAPSTPLRLHYRFEAGAEQRALILPATERGFELPVPQVGPQAANGLLQGLTDNADRLYIGLDGRTHMITADFDISYAAHAYGIVREDCAKAGA